MSQSIITLHIVSTIISALIILLTLIYGNLKTKTNRLILFLFLLYLSGYLVVFVVDGYNLLHITALHVCSAILLGKIIIGETKTKLLPRIGISFLVIVYILFLFTDFSSADFIDWPTSHPGKYIITLDQFNDISTLISLVSLILLFQWLYFTVKSESINETKTKASLSFIIGFMVIYGGTFFFFAFERILVVNNSDYMLLIERLFVPIDILSKLILFRGLLWK